ncbi:MAG: DUF262 domain-containing protein [Candidatus Cloacimonetes bacterium]|jgi:uncharacterized protein with ParB-like and HNH nuclease domain|nr:DUF262 domain-containing HNH endonuclease family protein [Candidatus Cloacimonadota bacterium]MDD2506921.1 DUF262 domain-containing protein [Candidatus Cloacimonadota bacterium]MDD4147682.1 DUF262 domain-containing protein [Candidatus Cloacimonadota bacterium]MDD4560387.1 DUF262 domain-containing protein [Candidatus Cloacimonadota bacterium]
MSKIENHKYTIYQAFNECFYNVPDYQREYVWQEKEVVRLLDDIVDEMDGNSKTEYFVGTVIVTPRGSVNQYDVIDGQQRLTTFYLILCAMKALFDQREEENEINSLLSSSKVLDTGKTKKILKLEPKYDGAFEIIQCIIKVNGDSLTTTKAIKASGVNTYGALKNIVNAYVTIYDYLNDNFAKTDELFKFWAYLANHVVFIQISTEISSALKIFETINERGIGLNPMDLMKNLIFRQADAEEFSKLKDEWKKITKPLEERQEKPLRFLRYYLMSNYPIDNSRKDNILREDEIYDWLVDENNANLCGYRKDPFAFVKHLIDNLNCYLAYINGKDKDGKENVYTDNLRMLCGGAFSLHYILMLAVRSLPTDLFNHFVKKLEIFLFYYIFTKTPTKELERYFAQWVGELRDITKLTDPDLQKTALDEFIDKHFVPNVQAKQTELQAFLGNYTLGTLQYYRTKYFLAKIAQYIEQQFTGVNDKRSLRDFSGFEIEHILPDNPEDWLRTEFVNGNPNSDYDLCKTKLGNLTLLEKTANIVASNSRYLDKCSQYRVSGIYLTRSLVEMPTIGNQSSVNRINQYLKVFPDWNAAAIDERQQLLINLALEVWKI